MGCGSSKSTETSTVNRTPTPKPAARNDEPIPQTTKQPKPAARDEEQFEQKREKQPTPVPRSPSPVKEKPKVDDFAQQALKAHNEYRSSHDAPPLRLAEDLNAYAQKWAENIAKRDQMQHSNCTMDSGQRIGENIYYSWSSDPNACPKGSDAVKSWYDEIKDYDYNKPGFAMNTGHFTQVVWKGSQEMGIAKAKSPKGSWFVVANYRPPGNYQGQFEQNVLRKN